MLDLPKSTAFWRIIPKDRIHKSGGANRELQRLFASQVERVRWLNKIAPDIINIEAGDAVTEIEVVEVAQAVETLDRRILPLIVKAIPYKLLFILSYGGTVSYAVHYSGITYTNEVAPRFLGNDLDAVWENLVVQVGNIAMLEGNTLDQQLAYDAERKKLLRRIEQLERQARSEKQPRRKFDLVQEVNALRGHWESQHDNAT